MTFDQVPDLCEVKINNLDSSTLQRKLDALYTLFNHGISKGNSDMLTGLDHRLTHKVLFELWVNLHPNAEIRRHHTTMASGLLRSTRSGPGAALALMLLLYVRFHRFSPLEKLDVNAVLMAWLLAGRLLERKGLKIKTNINNLVTLAYHMNRKLGEMARTDFPAIEWDQRLRCFCARPCACLEGSGRYRIMTLDEAERKLKALCLRKSA